jgi:hypothetical protein
MMDEWWPINSAPKDGTEIFVAWQSKSPGHAGPAGGGGWRYAITWWGKNRKGKKGWHHMRARWKAWPSHWMPLPPSPGTEPLRFQFFPTLGIDNRGD